MPFERPENDTSTKSKNAELTGPAFQGRIQNEVRTSPDYFAIGTEWNVAETELYSKLRHAFKLCKGRGHGYDVTRTAGSWPDCQCHP